MTGFDIAGSLETILSEKMARPAGLEPATFGLEGRVCMGYSVMRQNEQGPRRHHSRRQSLRIQLVLPNKLRELLNVTTPVGRSDREYF